jgi:hypothetical protein
VLTFTDVTAQAPAGCQRWRERRSSYRPSGEPIDPRRFAVEEVDEASAKAFVVRHHYSGSYPATRARYGLWRTRGPVWKADLVGVVAYSVPQSEHVIPKWLEVGPRAGVELGRLVLLDEVAANGETWFVSRALRLVRRQLAGLQGVVMFSDPIRVGLGDGSSRTPGHIGGVYQALSAEYRQRTNRATRWYGPDGHVISNRTLGKLRRGERGRGYSERDLVRLGAPPRRLHEDAAAWVDRALSEGPFTRYRHPGNHAYVWRFGARKSIVPAAYPKATSHRPEARDADD